LGVVVALDGEDILVEAEKAGADLVHGEGVSGEVDEAGVFGEGEEGASGVEPDIGGPVGQVARGVPGEVVVDGIEVEAPSVSAVALHQCVLEEGSPFGTEDVLLEVGTDGIEAAFDVESLEEVEISSQFGHALVVVLIHGGGVDAEVACHLIEVVARGSEGYLGSQPVASESGHRDPLLVHEASDIV
jgi:hypothetical protein